MKKAITLEKAVCIVDGCNKNRKKKSKYCSMHRARLIRTGRLDKKSSIERLFDHIIKLSDGCWEYTAYKNKWGYGRSTYGGKKMLSHRFIYEYYFGEIADGLLICHHCDNPACVNPEHLYLGTPKTNARDMSIRNRCWLQRAKEQGLIFNLEGGIYPDGYKTVR